MNHENDPLDLLSNKPALKSDEQLSREYWAGLTRLQVFIEHGKLFLMFVGFSVIYGAATAMIHVPATAWMVFGALYLISLAVCMKR